jgi:hypothetical protein
MSRWPRLSKNRSTPSLLRSGELLVGAAWPISTRVHQLLIVVGDNGSIEWSERVTGGHESDGVYHSECGQISAETINQIRADATVLALKCEKIEGLVPFSQIDPFAYESNDRRTLAFWHNDVRRTCGVWSQELYTQFGVSVDCVDAYCLAFDAVWTHILNNACFHFVETPTFPLRTRNL